jgi:hypothetical protein
LLNTDLVTVMSGPVCAGISGSITGVTLPADGIYAALIDPTGTLVGSVKVAITSTAAIQTITPAAPSIALSIPAGATIDLGFQGTKNKFVSIQTKNGNADCLVNYKVVRPTNTDLFSSTCAPGGTGFTDATTLPSTGDYKLRITSTAAATRVVTFQLWVSKDVTKPIVLDGAAVKTAALVPGQREFFTFNGTSGTTVNMNLTGSTISSYCMYLIRPDASTLTGQCFTTGNDFFADTALDATGVWKIEVDPQFDAAGAVTVELNTSVVGSGTIVVDGAAKTATIASSGGTVVYTFSATAGEKVAGQFTNSTIANGSINILRPDNSNARSEGIDTSDRFMEPVDIDVSGTWSLVVDPSAANTGSITVQLNSAPDITGSITLGTAKAVTITKPGQRAVYSFTGAVNQRITTTISGNTFPDCGDIHLVAPDTNTPSLTCTQDGFTDPIVLDQAGTWQVVIDPYSNETGGLTITLSDVSDSPAQAITVGGATKTATISDPGRRVLYTFTGALNQRIAMTITASTFTNCGSVYLLGPDNSQPNSACPQNGFTDPVPLDVAGTWTLVIDPYNNETGQLTIKLTSPTDITGTITPATAQIVTIGTAGQRALYTFSGTSGTQISSQITGNTFANCGAIDLMRPDQSIIPFTCTQDGFAGPAVLDQSGTWTLVVDPYSTDTGQLSITLTASTGDIHDTITIGTAKTVTISNPGQQSFSTFTGALNQRIAMTITGSTFPNCGSVYLLGPDSSQPNFACTQDGFTDPVPLDVAGTWTLVVDPYYADTGQLTITLSSVVDDTGTITLGTAKAVSLGTPGERGLYTFTGALNQKIATTITGTTFANCGEVYLIAPDTSQINVTCTQDGFTDPVVLTQAGTWTLVIDPYSTDTGGLSIKLESVPDLTGTIAIGTAKTVTISKSGQQARYTFTGSATQRIAMTISGNTFTNCGSVYLQAPDTNTVNFACTANGFTDPVTLGQAGTWTLVVDPYYADTGQLTITLSSITDVTGTITLGTAKAVSITTQGQRALYTFNRTSGQGMKASIASSNITSGTVSFLDPSGNLVTACGFGSGSAVCGPVSAPSSGTYTVVIDPDGTNIGSLNLTITAS